jgi:TetR/AcrR family transcriptional regulator, ethionamide resistance regulator
MTRSIRAVASARRRRPPEEARTEIIDVARVFLRKRPFRELTIEKLMAGTKIGRSAFYVYFKDIYDLFEVFVHEVTQEIDKAISEWIKHPGDHKDALRKGLEQAIAYWRPNAKLIRALQEASFQNETFYKIWTREFSNGPVQLVALAIERYQNIGVIRPLDPQEISVALNTFNLSYLNASFGGPAQRSPDEVLAVLMEVWFGVLYGAALPPMAGAGARKAK